MIGAYILRKFARPITHHRPVKYLTRSSLSVSERSSFKII
jgi:hypothetical protein